LSVYSIVSSIRTRSYLKLIVVLVLLGEVLLLYGPIIHQPFVADDWVWLQHAMSGFTVIFANDFDYQYRPITAFMMWINYTIFGMNVTAYHIVVIILLFVSAMLVKWLGYRLLKSVILGGVAGFIFVAYGVTFEAIIWTNTSFQILPLTVLYVTGVISYAIACDESISRLRRRWAYFGFLTCLLLAPFAHEQGLTLIGACALYRFFVVEHSLGFGRSALIRRFRAWTRTTTRHPHGEWNYSPYKRVSPRCRSVRLG
jgi:hypothetical protein